MQSFVCCIGTSLQRGQRENWFEFGDSGINANPWIIECPIFNLFCELFLRTNFLFFRGNRWRVTFQQWDRSLYFAYRKKLPKFWAKFCSWWQNHLERPLPDPRCRKQKGIGGNCLAFSPGRRWRCGRAGTPPPGRRAGCRREGRDTPPELKAPVSHIPLCWKQWDTG